MDLQVLDGFTSLVEGRRWQRRMRLLAASSVTLECSHRVDFVVLSDVSARDHSWLPALVMSLFKLEPEK